MGICDGRRYEMDKLTNTFKVLSDDTRLRILMLLYMQDLCVCQICGILNISQPSVSKNLAKLRDMNIVVDTRKEKFIEYSIVRNNHDNTFLLSILSQLQENIKEYPILFNDNQRIMDKDHFLNLCDNKITN
jgi:ArsR family transcriptional regulator